MRQGHTAQLIAISAACSLAAGVHAQSQPGWTFFAPMNSSTTVLTDETGALVHSWPGTLPPGVSVYLLPDGDILRPGIDANTSGISSGGAGGRIQRTSWDGTLEWDYVAQGADFRAHHDLTVLPNGNIVYIAWERKTATEAIDAGRNPAFVNLEIWPEKLVEIRPIGTDDAEVVWEWRLWDHLVQDFDATKPNFGAPSDNPHRIDINYPPNNSVADWIHWNAVDYNAERDELIVGSTTFHEIWVIDRPTGDIVYRWGNPAAYGMGIASDRKLFTQHDPEWIRPGLPGAGNILIYNNGRNRTGGEEYSSIDELIPPRNPDGTYARDAAMPFGPAAPAWTCDNADGERFYSSFISGSQRQPNGNTLICVGALGEFIEVNPACEVQWSLTNPFGGTVFRVDRIPTNDTRLWNRAWCAGNMAAPTDEVTVLDLLAYLTLWFGQDAGADIINADGVDIIDLLGFLASYFEGCAL